MLTIREYAKLKGRDGSEILRYINSGIIKAERDTVTHYTRPMYLIPESELEVELPEKKIRQVDKPASHHNMIQTHTYTELSMSGIKDKNGYYDMTIVENRSSLRRYAYNMRLYCERHPECPFDSVDYSDFVREIGYNFD